MSAVNTIYWPVTSPTKQFPWVIGGTNLLSWTTGGGTGIDSFDIQLHNGNRSIMVGFIPIALRVPMERLPTGRKNFGGEMEIDLDANIPTGYVERMPRGERPDEESTLRPVTASDSCS